MSQNNSSEWQGWVAGGLGGGLMAAVAPTVQDQLAGAIAGAAHPWWMDTLTWALPTAMAAGGTSMVGISAAALAVTVSPRGRRRTRYNHPGWATRRELRRKLSRRAALHQARLTRESYSHITWWNSVWHARRWRPDQPATDYGIFLGNSLTGPTFARRVYAAPRDVLMIIAPPQTGKTAMLCGIIIDAPGAAVATSTKVDIYTQTEAMRREVGPVHVFNPAGLGGVASTFRWCPVRGCDNHEVAEARAAALVRGAAAITSPAARGGDTAFWEGKAVALLRCFLMAAAVAGLNMATVARWALSPTDSEALGILEAAGDKVPPGWANELRQMLHSPDRTRDSVFFTLTDAVKFMSNPVVARMTTPAPDEPALDLEEFVASRGTLYLLGENSELAPLVVALTTHLFDGAKQLAAAKPKGRLDPPMMFALDEAALIVPVDLSRWVADAGGRNITIVFAAQTLAQLERVYGREGARVIRGAVNTSVFFGGQNVAEDAEPIVRACGEYETTAVTETEGGRGDSTSKHKVMRPVLTLAAFRELPDGHALVMHRNAKPVLVRTVPIWARADYKRAQKVARKAAKIPAPRSGADAPTPAEESA